MCYLWTEVLKADMQLAEFPFPTPAIVEAWVKRESLLLSEFSCGHSTQSLSFSQVTGKSRGVRYKPLLG